jgi:pyruvate/2-oxoglutarate dehydrogenase complex dihydrolipoamide acyltransferase (E2) component
LAKPNIVRRTVVWWFQPPSSPFVTVNFSVDATAARAYLASLAAGGTRVTLNHLVAACIARTLREHPYANGRIIGQRIVTHPHVGLAMPVNLLDAAGLDREISMAMIGGIDEMTLTGLAVEAGKTLSAERSGKSETPLIKQMLGLGNQLPHTLFKAALRAVDFGANAPGIGDYFFHKYGVTSALSNVGSTVKSLDGVLFRGADIHLPPRLFQVGTFWGTSAIQDEVVPIGGVPTVRPMLPVLMLFDHRMVDGVRGSRLVHTFCAALQNPAACFGANGQRVIGDLG